MLSTFQVIVIITVSFVVCWILSVAVMIFGVYDVAMAQAQLFLIDHGRGQLKHQNEAADYITWRTRAFAQLFNSVVLTLFPLFFASPLWVRPILCGMLINLAVRELQEFGYHLNVGRLESYDDEWSWLAYFSDIDDEVFDLPLRKNDNHKNLRVGSYYATFEALFYMGAVQIDHLPSE